MRPLLHLVGGIALGLTAGVLIGRECGAHQATPAAPDAAPRDAPDAAPRAPALTALASAPPPVVAHAPAQPAAGSPGPADALQAENDLLRTELLHATRKLAELQAVERDDLASAPVAPPPDLDPRFTQGRLLDAINGALRELEVDGAGVTSIDCTEYPCIVYGEGLGEVDGWAEKLMDTPPMAPYRRDSRQTWVWTKQVDGRPDRPLHHFGITFHPPENGGRAAQLKKRLDDRSQPLVELSDP